MHFEKNLCKSPEAEQEFGMQKWKWGEGGISILPRKEEKGERDWITGYSEYTEEQALGSGGIRQFWTMSLGSLEHWTSNSFESSSLKRKRNLQSRATAATPIFPALGRA